MHCAIVIKETHTIFLRHVSALNLWVKGIVSRLIKWGVSLGLNNDPLTGFTVLLYIPLRFFKMAPSPSMVVRPGVQTSLIITLNLFLYRNYSCKTASFNVVKSKGLNEEEEIHLENCVSAFFCLSASPIIL